MDEKRIRELLRAHKHSNGHRKLGCPDENALAAYVDGELDEGARLSLEKHASGCDVCLESVAFLARSADWSDGGQPAALLLRAKELVSDNAGPSWRWRWAFATAAAACVLLAMTFVFIKFREQQTPDPNDGQLIARNTPTSTPEAGPTLEPPVPKATQFVSRPNSNQLAAPSLRGNGDTAKPKLLFPREGSLLRQNEVVFRWEPTADAVLYTVRVAAADGSLMMQKESKDVSLTLGDDVAFQKDAMYYVTVVAHTSDGRSLKYEIRSFRLAQ